MALELPKLELKSKKGKTPGQQNDIVLKFVEFFDKNPFMKILIPIVLFIIILAIVAFLIFGDGVLFDKQKPVDTTTPTNEVSVLPGTNNVTDKEIVKLINDDPLSEDILATIDYVGMSSGSSGLKVAGFTIGADNDAISLSIGETVGDSGWELMEIYEDYVIFKAGEITKKISA